MRNGRWGNLMLVSVKVRLRLGLVILHYYVSHSACGISAYNLHPAQSGLGVGLGVWVVG